MKDRDRWFEAIPECSDTCPGLFTCVSANPGDECAIHGGFDFCCSAPLCPGNSTEIVDRIEGAVSDVYDAQYEKLQLSKPRETRRADLLGADPDFTGGKDPRQFIKDGRGEA